jgi:hypothetical protein
VGRGGLFPPLHTCIIYNVIEISLIYFFRRIKIRRWGNSRRLAGGGEDISPRPPPPPHIYIHTPHVSVYIFQYLSASRLTDWNHTRDGMSPPVNLQNILKNKLGQNCFLPENSFAHRHNKSGGGGNRNSESFKPFNRLRFLKTFLPVSYTTALWYFVIEEEFFVTEKDMFNLCFVSFLCEITYKHCIFCVDLKKECILEKVTLSPFWWCSHILKHFSHNI